jgi:aspartate ammonia-lyase
LITALSPALGYEEATTIAQEAHATGRGVVELVLAHGLLNGNEIDRLLASAMPQPDAAQA